VGSVFWTAVTYGAVTIMQVLGHKEGLNVFTSHTRYADVGPSHTMGRGSFKVLA